MFCWSDSEIAIWWICQIGKKWKCWIQNRFDTIGQNVAVDNWYYVPTKLNLADISTKKAKLDKINEKLWWNGSKFLLDVIEKWPSQEFRNSVKEKNTADISDEILVCSVIVEPLIIGVGKIFDLERFSFLDRLLRVTSYVLRFVHNVKSRVIKNLKLGTGYLSSEEFDNSEALWLKYEQGLIMFDSDCNYEKLKHSLNLYKDENNILRLKSRFDSLETLNHDQKNPILLRSHSLFTICLF